MKANVLYSLVAVAVIACVGCGNSGTKEVVAADGTKATVDKDGGSMTVTTPDGGTAAMGGAAKVSEADVQVPFYPGSTEAPDQSMKVETPNEKSYFSVRKTSDDAQKVADFYTAKLADMKLSKFETADTKTFMGNMELKDGAKVAISIMKKASEPETVISIGYGKVTKK